MIFSAANECCVMIVIGVASFMSGDETRASVMSCCECSWVLQREAIGPAIRADGSDCKEHMETAMGSGRHAKVAPISSDFCGDGVE